MSTPKRPDLAAENAELRAQLEEAHETLRAIRSGEVDALVMGEEVYTLKGAETPYRVLIEQMYEGAATLLDGGTVLYANRRLGQLLRTPLQELIGTSLRRFIAQPELPAFERLLAEGKQCSSAGEFALQRQDGSALPVQLSFSVVDEEDTRPICVIVTDLTERKRTELALRQSHDSLEQRVRERTEELQKEREWLSVTLGSIGDALIATDVAGRITFLNPVAETLTGWSRQEVLGQPVQNVFRILDETTRIPGEDIVGRVLREGAIIKLANNTCLIARAGREIPIEDSAAPIRDTNGAVAGAVLVFRDVTEKRRATQALRLAGEDLKRSNRDLEQFANVASHDLQEPLRAVIGYARLLQRGLGKKLSAKHREYLNGAVEGATRMEQLIQDLLAFSRVGPREGARAPADLNALLQEAQRNLQLSIQSTGAKITAGPLPTLVVDAPQVTQLFQNLLANALKFCRAGPPRIKVRARQEPGKWVISVRDNGIGIAPENFQRIFQIFQRLHTRAQYPGTGIGLTICQRIVERHSGSIWVESQPGQGSTFFFSIPETSTNGPSSATPRKPENSSR